VWALVRRGVLADPDLVLARSDVAPILALARAEAVS
jgi:hypothetical protein